ncbi:MAG TPA: response regulator [Vicinamibacterales bacterium]|jgi:CheY-like chemotaxis protein
MPYKLLLADDSVTIQRVIELTFADEDVKVTAVGDGQQAIDCIGADRPDIVLADVGMPKRDGYEVAAFVKDNPELAHIPVLLLTGAFEPVDEARARAAKCDGVLAKPFEPQMLIGRVKELLSGVKPSRSVPPPLVPAVAPVAVPPPAPPTPAAVVDEADEPTVRIFAPLHFGGQPEQAPTAQLPTAQPPAEPPPAALVVEEIFEATPVPILQNDTDMVLDPSSLNLRTDTPPPDSSLDDYFDRLDAAFAHLTGQPAGREGTATRSPGDLWPEPTPPAADWAQAAVEPQATFDVHPPADPAPSLAGADEGRMPVSSPVTPAAAEPEAAPLVAVPVADAFAALFDAEHRHGPEALNLGDPYAAASVMLPGTALTEDFIQDVARRVAERLGDGALRQVVADVVSTTTERLVREEIARLKASIR